MILLKIIWRKLALITTEVKTGILATEDKIKREKATANILHGGAVTRNVLGGLTVYPQVANFLYVCVHKKLWKLADSRLKLLQK